MIDIFIKSYQKDFKMLNYCLKSIEKHVTGYNKIVIVIPKNDYQIYKAVIHTDLPIELNVVDEYGNGYLYQQWCKISAHIYCESQFIMYVDSDCLFYKPVDIRTLIETGKPEILYTHYSKVGDAICWKQPTESFLGNIDYEFMRRLPLIYHTETLKDIAIDFPNLENRIMKSNLFSEFNLMGAYAYLKDNYKYNFVNTDEWEYVEPLTIQLWSHCRNNNSEVEKAEYKKAIESINNVLEINITEL